MQREQLQIELALVLSFAWRVHDKIFVNTRHQ